MENFTGIMSLIQLCVWLGTMIVCIVLVASGVLRWLAHPFKRTKRLNYAGWIAFAILSVTLLLPKIVSIVSFLGTKDGNKEMTNVVINISKATAKLAFLGALALTVAVILLVLIVFIVKGISAIVQSDSKATGGKVTRSKDIGDWAKALEKTSRDFRAVTQTPIFTFLLTCGILIVFLILPFLMGETSSGEGLANNRVELVDDKAGLAETWGNGIIKISNLIIYSEEDLSLNRAFITYTLLFVIVLGVGFTIIRILHAIIKDNLKERNTAGIIDEYAGSMGILGVGVSILFALKNESKTVFDDKQLGTIFDFLKYFAIVAVVMALVVVVLEIIRLIVDMMETLIRREAKYLFIALAGQVSLLVFSMLYTIYSALNSAIGGKLNIDLERIHNKLIQHIMNSMEEEADSETGHHKTTFTGFKGKVTKK